MNATEAGDSSKGFAFATSSYGFLNGIRLGFECGGQGHRCELVSRNGHTFKSWPQLAEEIAYRALFDFGPDEERAGGSPERIY
jgi:hypothetical protein